MSTTTYIKKKNHRLLDGINFKITAVHPYYRSGGLEVAGKYIGKVFVNFPKRLEDSIVLSGDERAKHMEGDEYELRERVWNKDLRVFEFHRYTGKLDREFYATYKKVYDVEGISDGIFSNPVWNKDSGKEEVVEYTSGTSFTLQEFPVGRLKNLIEALDLDEGIKLVPGKDKAGNEAMVKPFDWEDGYKGKLVDKFVTMKVRGTGMDTKYTFKEGKEFVIESKLYSDDKAPANEEANVNDLPF